MVQSQTKWIKWCNHRRLEGVRDCWTPPCLLMHLVTSCKTLFISVPVTTSVTVLGAARPATPPSVTYQRVDGEVRRGAARWCRAARRPPAPQLRRQPSAGATPARLATPTARLLHARSPKLGRINWGVAPRLPMCHLPAH